MHTTIYDIRSAFAHTMDKKRKQASDGVYRKKENYEVNFILFKMADSYVHIIHLYSLRMISC